MSKKLVAYFSATGTTKKAAERLAKAVNADLDWTNSKSRSCVEMNDARSLPGRLSLDINVRRQRRNTREMQVQRYLKIRKNRRNGGFSAL